MPNDQRTRLVLQCAAASALLFSLSACESIRNFVAGKEPPDEFAVVTKAPLIIPPDYNLKPPKPGIAPLNQVSPTQSAEAALYSDDPKAVAGSIGGNYSEAEKMLLAQTRAASASDSIRQQIAADNSNQQSADESFTDQLLFGSSASTTEAPLDADAEKARLDAAKARATAPAAAPQPAQQTQAVPAASQPAQQTQQTQAVPAPSQQSQQTQPAPAQKPSGG